MVADLGTVQDAPSARVESIPSVNNTAVIPEQYVAVLPLVVPVKLRLVDPSPQLIQQRF